MNNRSFQDLFGGGDSDLFASLPRPYAIAASDVAPVDVAGHYTQSLLYLDSSLFCVEGLDMGTFSSYPELSLSSGPSSSPSLSYSHVPSYPSSSSSSSSSYTAVFSNTSGFTSHPSAAYVNPSLDSLEDPIVLPTGDDFLLWLNVANSASSQSSFPPGSHFDPTSPTGISYDDDIASTSIDPAGIAEPDFGSTFSDPTSHCLASNSSQTMEHSYTRPLGSSSTYNSGPHPDARASYSHHQLPSTSHMIPRPSPTPSYPTQMASLTTIGDPSSDVASTSSLPDVAVSEAPRQAVQEAPRASKGKGKANGRGKAKAKLVDQGEDTAGLDSKTREVQANLKKRKRKEGENNGRSVRSKVEQPARENEDKSQFALQSDGTPTVLPVIPGPVSLPPIQTVATTPGTIINGSGHDADTSRRPGDVRWAVPDKQHTPASVRSMNGCIVRPRPEGPSSTKQNKLTPDSKDVSTRQRRKDDIGEGSSK